MMILSEQDGMLVARAIDGNSEAIQLVMRVARTRYLGDEDVATLIRSASTSNAAISLLSKKLVVAHGGTPDGDRFAGEVGGE